MKPRVLHLGRIIGKLAGKAVAIEHGMVIDLGTPRQLDLAANSGFMEFDLAEDDDTLAQVTVEFPSLPTK